MSRPANSQFPSSQSGNNSNQTAMNGRRRFLQAGSGAVVAAALTPWHAWAARPVINRSPNDRPNIGCIGVGSMGTGDAHEHSRFANIMAVCDVDQTRVDAAWKDPNIGKENCDRTTDYREILDRKDIDTVSIVTPDQWHVKIALEAMAAGKHVFCQKPLTFTLEEGQLIRKACEQHPKQVFVVGTQQRSDRDRFLRAVNMVQKGLLGKITKVTVGIDGSPTGGPFPVATPPEGLNWDRWLGPAPLVDYREKRCHYEFRWWYEYSGGKFTDWGAHHVDIATWATNRQNVGHGPIEIDGTDAKHPVEFRHGMPVADDSYNTSHDFNVVCKYDDGMEMHITSRGDNGILFEGTKGRIFVNRGKIEGMPVKDNWDEGKFGDAEVQELYKGKPFEGHKQNFYRCITEGGLPVSDVWTHVQVMNVCHLASISARLGRNLKWDCGTATIRDDEEAATFMSRSPRKGFEYFRG